MDGWTVTGADGGIVGVVDQLVVGPQAGRSRYMVVRVDDRWIITDDQPRHVVAPLGCTQIVPGHREIALRALNAADCVRLPIYGGGPISEDDETTIWWACVLAASPSEWDVPGRNRTPSIDRANGEATKV